LVRVFHSTNPCIESSIFKSVAKAREYKDDRQYSIRRMGARDSVGNQFADRCNYANPELAILHVDLVVEKCGECVTYEGSEEDQGYDGVVDVVVRF
jgi:hypothetical protein